MEMEIISFLRTTDYEHIPNRCVPNERYPSGRGRVIAQAHIRRLLNKNIRVQSQGCLCVVCGGRCGSLEGFAPSIAVLAYLLLFLSIITG
jgi:hypothetical protein